MARSLLQNGLIGTAYRYLFDLTGEREFPSYLETDAIQPVVDVANGGFCRYEVRAAKLVSDPINGISTRQYFILTPDSTFTRASQIPTTLPKLAPNKARRQGPDMFWDVRVLGIDCTWTFDAAGATARAADHLSLSVSMLNSADDTSTCQVSLYTGWALPINAGKLVYTWSMGGFSDCQNQDHLAMSWNGWVPWGNYLLISQGIAEGNNFPANSTFSYQIMTACVPRYAQVPV